MIEAHDLHIEAAARNILMHLSVMLIEAGLEPCNISEVLEKAQDINNQTLKDAGLIGGNA